MSGIVARLCAVAALVVAVGVVVAVLASAAPSRGLANHGIRPLPQNFFRP
jgi:hypothetical protein